MHKVIYQVIEHAGGWAYRSGETISETFPTHGAARKAADRAAAEQVVVGQPTEIAYQDASGRAHREFSAGDDRPTTKVED